MLQGLSSNYLDAALFQVTDGTYFWGNFVSAKRHLATFPKKWGIWQILGMKACAGHRTL